MIYFVQAGDDGPVKIGYTDSVKRRLDSLRSANAETLHLLAIVDGDRATEQSLHARFVGQRMNGEWFNLSRLVVADVVAALIAHPHDERSEQTEERRCAEAIASLVRPERFDWEVVRIVFGDRRRVRTSELCAVFGCNARTLGLWLAGFDIRPKCQRWGERILRGYEARDFEQIWAYLDERSTAGNAGKPQADAG